MVSSATPRALLDEEVGSLAGRRANWMDVWLRGRVGGSVNGVLGGWVIGSLNGWVDEWSLGWVGEWLAEEPGVTNAVFFGELSRSRGTVATLCLAFRSNTIARFM